MNRIAAMQNWGEYMHYYHKRELAMNGRKHRMQIAFRKGKPFGKHIPKVTEFMKALAERIRRGIARNGVHLIFEDELRLIWKDSEAKSDKQKQLMNFATAYGFSTFVSGSSKMVVFRNLNSNSTLPDVAQPLTRPGRQTPAAKSPEVDLRMEDGAWAEICPKLGI
jgi:hypothetical protein